MPRGRPRRKVAEVKEDAEVEKNDHEDDVEKVSKSRRGKKQKVESKENVSNSESEDPPVKKKKTVGSGTVSKITIEHCTS